MVSASMGRTASSCMKPVHYCLALVWELGEVSDPYKMMLLQ